MTLDTKLNELTVNKDLYGIDWLKIELSMDVDPDKLNSGLRYDVVKTKDGYDTENAYKSYRPQQVRSSSNGSLSIQPLNGSTVRLEGNFFKFLNGHNVTGRIDLNQLVYDVVLVLMDQLDGFNPNVEQLEQIKLGFFKINKIDLNKAILFESKEESLKHLERLKHHSSYPRQKKDTENNGVYFGKTSKRRVTKFYYKGVEVLNNKKAHPCMTPELKAYADLMVRFEMRLKWRELNDSSLLYGYSWDEQTVIYLVEKYLGKLKLPEYTLPEDMPKKYVKFISCMESGTAFGAYSSTTIKRMKSDLIRKHGYYFD